MANYTYVAKVSPEGESVFSLSKMDRFWKMFVTTLCDTNKENRVDKNSSPNDANKRESTSFHLSVQPSYQYQRRDKKKEKKKKEEKKQRLWLLCRYIAFEFQR